MQSDQEILPPLREDLELIPSKDNLAGDKTYVIRDIRANRYIRIGADTFRIMAMWQPNISVSDFQKFLSKNSIIISDEDLRECIKKISAASLFQFRPEYYTQKIKDHEKNKYKNTLDKFIHNYLFFKIPLFYPDQFIKKTIFITDIFFSRTFMILTASVALVAVFFMIPQIDRLKAAFSIAGNFEMILKFCIALSLSKIVHEFSHAYAAARKDCHVGSVGIGFIVGAPVFYADVTDTWRLNKKHDRFIVAASGVIAELILAVYATIIWLLNFNPFINDVTMYLATTTWITTVIFNANPLMRFDGYFLLSDFLDIKNLQQKSFVCVGQKFREFVFGFHKKPINNYEVLLTYGLAAMAYRVIVITGVALVLYHFVFRLLGFVLFVIEIWIFLLKPLLGVFIHVWKYNDKTRLFRARIGAFALVCVISLIIFTPIDMAITVPGILTREQVNSLYQKYDAQVAESSSVGPVEVDKGELILSATNPFVQIELNSISEELFILKNRYQRLSIAPLEKDLAFSLAAELERAKVRKYQINDEIKQLTIMSPSNGNYFPRKSYKDNEIVAAKTFIGTLVSGSDRIIAFVPEKYLYRLSIGMLSDFYNPFDMKVLSGKITQIEKSSVERIKYPQLASVYGGPIKSHGSLEKGLYSEEALYRVIISGEGQIPTSAMQIGNVSIRVSRSSLAMSFLDAAQRTILREAHID